MADTITTNYAFVKPDIGGSTDTWGDKVNDNFDSIDATIKSVANSVVTVSNSLSTLASTVSGISTSLSYKADASSVYTKGEVDGFRTTDQNAAKNASNLTTGTVADDRLPARLQSGSALSLVDQPDAEAGVENTKAMTALRTKQQIDARLKRYTSGEISIIISSLTTLTHDLGAEPGSMQAYLVCKTAELGYSVGDKVKLGGAAWDGAGSDLYGVQLAKNSTSIFVSFANHVPYIARKTGGTGVYVTAANWRVVVEAAL